MPSRWSTACSPATGSAADTTSTRGWADRTAAMTTRPDLAARTPALDAPAIPRFDRTQRIVHWTTATCVLVLIVTGLCLYAGPLSTLVGRRHLLRTVHVVAGLATFVPFLVSVAGRHGRALRADVVRINRWTRDDAQW